MAEPHCLSTGRVYMNRWISRTRTQNFIFNHVPGRRYRTFRPLLEVMAHWNDRVKYEFCELPITSAEAEAEAGWQHRCQSSRRAAVTGNVSLTVGSRCPYQSPPTLNSTATASTRGRITDWVRFSFVYQGVFRIWEGDGSVRGYRKRNSRHVVPIDDLGGN